MAGNPRFYTPSILNGLSVLFNTAVVAPKFLPLAATWYNKMIANKSRYETIARAVNASMPWYVVALLHMRESGMDFSRHLHNGDPLTKRTTHVPAGRPIAKPRNGKYYTFEESAIDALTQPSQRFQDWRDWSIPGILHVLEMYNGAGYALRGVTNPYVWSGTQWYTGGKYVADGKYSATATDTQLGAGALLKYFLDTEGKKKIPTSNPYSPADTIRSVADSVRFFFFGR